ncbi:hypothetical protein CBR_g44366 [Chara braunii]|uniref:Uncharacterized protein n=1 Tax=Chara braunii TaxID=69332 RepID=A0A388LX57_CHABU|nr:hypothetical protein CBR_g44366 [Chara braunii]|eukprot:GBG86910.1 hypothetical protein CBR_g44366 [Chara braunii]
MSKDPVSHEMILSDNPFESAGDAGGTGIKPVDKKASEKKGPAALKWESFTPFWNKGGMAGASSTSFAAPNLKIGALNNVQMKETNQRPIFKQRNPVPQKGVNAPQEVARLNNEALGGNTPFAFRAGRNTTENNVSQGIGGGGKSDPRGDGKGSGGMGAEGGAGRGGAGRGGERGRGEGKWEGNRLAGAQQYGAKEGRSQSQRINWWPDEEDSEEEVDTEGKATMAEETATDVDTAKQFFEKCYDWLQIPDTSKLAKFTMKEKTVTISLDPKVEEAHEEWLRDNVVVIFFQGSFRSVSAERKEECVRILEYTLLPVTMHQKERGRVHQEGRNVMSYLPRDKKTVEFLLKLGAHKIKVGSQMYKMSFKKWMSQKQIEESRVEDEVSKIWIMALRVPYKAVSYMKSALAFAIGKISKQYPPERYEDAPKLNNLKFDIPRELKERVPDGLEWPQADGTAISIRIVTQFTDYCHFCKDYAGHPAAACPQSIAINTVEQRQQGGAGSAQGQRNLVGPFLSQTVVQDNRGLIAGALRNQWTYGPLPAVDRTVSVLVSANNIPASFNIGTSSQANKSSVASGSKSRTAAWRQVGQKAVQKESKEHETTVESFAPALNAAEKEVVEKVSVLKISEKSGGEGKKAQREEPAIEIAGVEERMGTQGNKGAPAHAMIQKEHNTL